MKSFKQHIDEEWHESIKATIGKSGYTDVWKNPTVKEFREFTSEVDGNGAAGIFHKNNVYLFDGERNYHRNVFSQLKLTETADTVNFRMRLTNNKNRIMEIELGGDDSVKLRSNKKPYKKYAKNSVALFNHQSINPHKAQRLTKMLDDIISWQGEQDFEEATGISV